MFQETGLTKEKACDLSVYFAFALFVFALFHKCSCHSKSSCHFGIRFDSKAFGKPWNQEYMLKYLFIVYDM